MKFQEFIYTLKVCGIRWFVWILPFPLIIALMQGFGSQRKFNDNYVNAVRLGNSGLWLIYSQKIQDEIRKNREKSKRLEKEINREEIKRKYEEEFNDR